MAINFSDLTPSPPPGNTNIKWQNDLSGNVSGYVSTALGTVQSVALVMPPEFSVAGSPITTSGTLTATKVAQPPNYIYAGPSAGGNALPVFRPLTLADMPAGVGSVQSVYGRTGNVVAQAGDYNVAQVTNAVPNSLVISAGTGLSGGGDLTSSRSFSLLPAASAALGGVKIGSNVSVAADGTISVAAPFTLVPATASVLGGVKIGANINVAGDGTISVAPPANTSITVSDTAPASPINGALWFDSVGSQLYVYYQDPTSSQWVIAVNQPAVGQTPWTQNVNAAGYTLSNVPTVSGNGNITLAAGGAGNLTLQTSALTRLTVDQNGNVGIGTTTPWARLAVNGGTQYDPSVTWQSNASASVAGPTGELAVGQATASPNAMWIQSRQSTNASLPLALNPQGGNVGIGYINPQTRLQVTVFPSIGTVPAAGTYGGAAIFGCDSGAYGLYVGAINTGSGYIQAQRGDSATVYPLLIQPNGGNVGIGTTAPQATLEVNGNQKLNGYLETHVDSGVTCNLYWNNGWYYRNNGTGTVTVAATNGNIATAYFAAAGSAGAAASLNKIYDASVASGWPYVLFQNSTIISISGPGTPVEPWMPNNSTMIALTSNTQLTFRVRGADGVIRQASLTLA